MLKDFRAFQLAKSFYQRSKAIRLPLIMKDQFARASASIAMNIAEGSAKRTRQDQGRYYSIALGSLRECEAMLELENMSDPELTEIKAQLGAVLHKLSQLPAPPTQDET